MASIMKGAVLRGLDNFARMWIQPTVSLLRSASSEMERALAASTFVECCEWLGLCVQTNICPAEARPKLLLKFFDGVPISYELLENMPIWPAYMIENVRRLSDSTNENRPNLGNPESFRTLVQLSSSMAADLAFSPAGKAFASLLLFAQIPQWERFLAKPPHPGELAQALSGAVDPWLDGNRNLAYAGLVKTVEHTQGLSHLLEETYLHQFGDDWVSCREGVVAAHGWRLEPRPNAEKRYDAMVSAVDQIISEGLKESKVEIPMSFGEEAAVSLRRWRKITGPLEVAAGRR